MKNLTLLIMLLFSPLAHAALVDDIVQNAVIFQELDAPVFDTAVTNLNGSAGAQVTVVAAMTANSSLCRVNDTTGGFIGVYVAGSLVFIITPGMDAQIRCPIAAGAAVTMRSMVAAGVSGGTIVVQFMK